MSHQAVAPEIADTAVAGLSTLRDRFDGAAKFVAEIDNDYLADDWAELAEAVGYLRLVMGDETAAVARLRDIGERTNGVEPETAQRAGRMSALIDSDPGAARAVLEEWRQTHLRHYGLD